LELSTPRLSSVCSNQLSYWPDHGDFGPSRPDSERFSTTCRGFSVSASVRRCCHPHTPDSLITIDRNRAAEACPNSRKEVIQPQVPLRLPCYDFTPVTSHSLGGCLTRLAHRLLEQLTP